MVGFLAGCTDQIIELLTTVDELIDEQLGTSEESDGQAESKEQEAADDKDKIAESTDDETNDETEEDPSESGNEINDLYGHDIVPPTTYIPELINHREPFDDRLRSQGYDILPAPIHLPLPIPYEWVYVEDFDGNTDPDYFSGKFCFDIPLPLTVIASYFDDYFTDITQETAYREAHPKHTTFISVNETYEVWDAQIKYNEDVHGNLCALVEIEYDWDAIGKVGEDSTQMISDEEMSQELQGEGKGAFQETRDRKLPEGFSEELADIRDEHDYFDDSFAISAKEAIMYRQYDMSYRNNYLPKVFLYDAYVLDHLESEDSNDWSGTMCTDIPLHKMVAKHLDMLADYNADIEYFETGGNIKANVVAETGFAFNDEFGTGSYEGTRSEEHTSELQSRGHLVCR